MIQVMIQVHTRANARFNAIWHGAHFAVMSFNGPDVMVSYEVQSYLSGRIKLNWAVDILPTLVQLVGLACHLEIVNACGIHNVR